MEKEEKKNAAGPLSAGVLMRASFKRKSSEKKNLFRPGFVRD
jgi:hypothetical protein